MALQEEFQRTGNWLFRWRSYLPLFLIVLVGLSMTNYHYPFGSRLYDWLWEGLCFLVGFFGMAIRAITIGHTPAKTSGRNTKAQVADKLNTAGIYSLVRNPLYLGNYFMMLGIVLFPRNIWGIVVFTLLFALYYERIIYAEEAYLRVKFGEEYLDWAAKTPAFFPRFTNFRRSGLSFSFRNVLKREYSGFFGFILSMFIVEVFGDWVISGRVHVQTGWWIILGSGFVIYLTVRTLKKNTQVFNVVGR